MKKIFLLDFDGTITKQDTCEAMVEAFADEGWQVLNELWEQRKISTVECAQRTFELCHASWEDLRQLLDTIELDEGFEAFLNYCRHQGYPIYVLSDGYDFNIEYLFQKQGVNVPFFANHLAYNDGFQISCPHHNPDCGKCGTCKSNLLKQLTPPGAQCVYIGDGISDTCPARQSDLVFAKGKLLKYCQDNGISVVPYTGFAEVLAKLQEGNISLG